MYRVALLALLVAQAGARPARPPSLQIEGPPELTAVRTRLQSIDPRRFGDITQFIGDDDTGRTVRVILAPENSDLARGVSRWIAGFAVGASDVVVLFPARSPSYPDGILEDVLRHEVAHVLIWRASAGQPVPRWFDEGLAMAAERDLGLEDQTRLLYQLATGDRTSLGDLNRLFSGSQRDQTRAYALAGALVHEVLQRFGSAVCGQVLIRVRRGAQFDAAFADVTGLTPDRMDEEFWQHQRIWTTWLPVVSSPATLWLAVTMLVILAIYRRRQKHRALEKQWALENNDVHHSSGGPPSDTVH